jgi:hypothetical protein
MTWNEIGYVVWPIVYGALILLAFLWFNDVPRRRLHTLCDTDIAADTPEELLRRLDADDDAP